MQAQKRYRKKKAIARNYAKKERQQEIMGSGAYYKGRPVVQRRPRAPLYRNMPSSSIKPRITGNGKYNFSSAGADLGKALGYGLDYILGRGDYTIRANSIMGGVYDPPELHNRSDKTVCIRHREYITDIIASSGFNLQSYEINPGLSTTFPWLSQVAEAFEEYRFTGIVFEFKTLSADYTTASSAALGYVIMATQYNTLSPNFPDKITMENYEFANSGKPSVTFLHPVECKRALNPVSELFVRTGAITTGDLRLYDHGNFQIATGGNTGSGVIGELWCTFEVEFYKPKLVTSIGSELKTDHWVLGSVTSTQPMGTLQVLQPGSNLGTALSETMIIFPPNVQDGKYMITYSIAGNVTSSVTPPISGISTSNCSFFPEWQIGGQAYISRTESTGYLIVGYVIINAASATITLGTGNVVPTSNSGDLWVMQINGDIDT